MLVSLFPMLSSGRCHLGSPHLNCIWIGRHRPLPLPEFSPFIYDAKSLAERSIGNARGNFNPISSQKNDSVFFSETKVEDEVEFVEIGSIVGTHGIRGELRVRSSTDFPEERFQTPGLRWLRSSHMGKNKVCNIELVKGRIGPGKPPTWLVTLKNVDTPELAATFVGATMMVKSKERPSLMDEEFYIPDLIGMDVVLKESGKLIGTTVDVYNIGDSDLLRVRLCNGGECAGSLIGSMEANEISESLVWIPFVKAIVPEVDMEARTMFITPPVGLLELNMGNDGLSKQEIRKQETKGKRKLREKIAGLKKSLRSFKQEHVLSGLSIGEKSDQNVLLDQLLDTDFRSLQTLYNSSLNFSSSESLKTLSNSMPLPSFPVADWQSVEKLYVDQNEHIGNMKNLSDCQQWWRDGLELISQGKTAIVTVTADLVSACHLPSADMIALKDLFQVQAEKICLVQKLARQAFPGREPKVPWVIMVDDCLHDSINGFFNHHSFFGLDKRQVSLVGQDFLPIFEFNASGSQHQIMMGTPWRMMKAPVGDGNVLNALQKEGLLDLFFKDGIQYLQVYDICNLHAKVADPIFFGFSHHRKVELGLKVVPNVLPDIELPILFLPKPVCAIDNELPGNLDSNSMHYAYLDRRIGIAEAYDEQPTHVPSKGVHPKVLSLGIYVLSINFLKQLQSQKFVLEYKARLSDLSRFGSHNDRIVHETCTAVRLSSSLLDLLSVCSVDKVAMLGVNQMEKQESLGNNNFALQDNIILQETDQVTLFNAYTSLRGGSVRISSSVQR